MTVDTDVVITVLNWPWNIYPVIENLIKTGKGEYW